MKPRLDILQGRSIAVLGLARTGLSVLKALQGKVQICAWDDNEDKRVRAASLGAEIASLTPEILKNCASLVLSPGIPLHYPVPHPVVQAARDTGTEVICDIELFSRLYPDIKTVGITGTNGKSTTTALSAYILKSCGLEAEAGGNIGTAIFDLDPEHILILELSSYQLDLCPTFRPGIAVLLNISPDHLDRHGTMQAYVRSKGRILEGKGVHIVGIDDKNAAGLLSSNDYAISVEKPVKKGAYIERGTIFEAQDGEAKPIGPVENLKTLKGTHNHQNLLAAYMTARCFDLAPEDIMKAAASFPGLSHRQFPVRTIGHVAYINDSKATNAEAAGKALQSYADIHWIAGGRPKEGGLQGLEPFMKNVRHAYLIGEAMDSFSDWMLKNRVPFHLSENLERALRHAHNDAQKQGGTVLLSPACASWDQYSSFEERGDHFTMLVGQLSEKAAS